MTFLKEGFKKIIGRITAGKQKLSLTDLSEEDAAYLGRKVLSGEVSLTQAANSLQADKNLQEPVDQIEFWISDNF